jgi:hypothetical protein
MPDQIQFSFSFTGSSADDHVLDLYDVSQALLGFQRSLALTTHLVLNGQIITQTPFLKGAKIYALPPEAGSWQLKALIVVGATGLYNLGTAQSNSPLGHIMYSLYDYVVSESLGVHVDYNKSLGKLYEEAQEKKVKVKPVTQNQADSLIEKCETAIREMHRPIYMSQTAEAAGITCKLDKQEQPLHTSLTLETFNFIHETRQSETPEIVVGRISSYNINTFKGRIYVAKLGRPISFELAPKARTKKAVGIITNSLHQNASNQREVAGSLVHAVVLRNTSKTGHLKRLTVLSIGDATPEGA